MLFRSIECAWPGQAFLDRTIKQGQQLLVTGPVRYYHGRQLVPREYVILADDEDEGDASSDGLILPVYPATDGLSHRVIRKIIGEHLATLLPLVEDDLPRAVLDEAGVPPLTDALRMVHRPVTSREYVAGRRRLAMDEIGRAHV